jgi:hypothetical protein
VKKPAPSSVLSSTERDALLKGKWLVATDEMDITFAKRMFRWPDPIWELEDYDPPVHYDQKFSVNGVTEFPEYGSDGGIISTRSFRVPFHITPGGQSCTV